MTCSCSENAKGEVTSPCGAHVYWFNQQIVGQCGKIDHGQHDKLVRDLEHKTKLVEWLERMVLKEQGKI